MLNDDPVYLMPPATGSAPPSPASGQVASGRRSSGGGPVSGR